MTIYNMCRKPQGCCPEIEHKEDDDLYRIFDEAENWESGMIGFEELIQIRDIINEIEKKRNDIKDL